jgi:hypothetical protein
MLDGSTQGDLSAAGCQERRPNDSEQGARPFAASGDGSAWVDEMRPDWIADRIE